MHAMDITHVAIGIISARNPDGLRETLTALQSLTFTAHSAPTLSILVAGIEAAGPTASTAQSFGNVTYLHEPTPGIAPARNKILDHLPEGAQLVAWIDDDTRPSAEWLAELLKTRAETNAAIVLGTITAHLPADAPDWVQAGGFFNRRRFSDRAPLLEGVNNSLMDIAVIHANKLRFTTDSGSTSASDAVFLRSAARKGLQMAWTPAATSTEYIPLARCSLGWLFNLNFRIGAMLGRSAWKVEGMAMGFKRLGEGMGEVVRGILFLPIGLFAVNQGVRSLLQIAMGCGVILGAFGYRPR